MDPQSLNRYAYVRNNPLGLVDPDGHFFRVPIAIAAIWAGTEGHPFNSSSWANFNFQSAAIAASAAYAGQWGYGLAGMGFGGAVLGGTIGGIVGGGLDSAFYGGNVIDGIGQGMANGEVSGIVNGAIGSAGIFNVGLGGVGGMENPIANMAGAYVSSRALGGDSSDASHAARNSFWESALSNGAQLTYNAIQGPPKSGTYLMGARLREGPTPGFWTTFKGVVSSGLSIFGMGHSDFADADTGETIELDDRGHRGIVRRLPYGDRDNSLKVSGHRFGAWFQPLDISFDSIPIPTGGDRGAYNIFTGSCNTYTWHDVLGR
jgi:hypothetical protein